MVGLSCPEHHDHEKLRRVVYYECGTDLCIGHEESQTQAAEAGFNYPYATHDLFLEPGKQPVGQSQEPNTIGPGALATRTGLHAEEVVQQRAHKVVVEESVPEGAGMETRRKQGRRTERTYFSRGEPILLAVVYLPRSGRLTLHERITRSNRVWVRHIPEEYVLCLVCASLNRGSLL